MFVCNLIEVNVVISGRHFVSVSTDLMSHSLCVCVWIRVFSVCVCVRGTAFTDSQKRAGNTTAKSTATTYLFFACICSLVNTFVL